MLALPSTGLYTAMNNMNKNIIYSFFLFPFALIGQPGFNKLIDAGYSRNDIWDMVVVRDTVIGFGFGFDDTAYNHQVLILTKFDSNGVLLKSATIADSLGDAFAIQKTWGKIIPTSDGGFAMTAATVYRESAFLIKTDSDFNVEFVKEYPDTVNLSNFYYKLFETPDGYILYGYIQLPNYLFRPFVRRVDKQGNTIWFKLYGSVNVSNTFVRGSQFQDSLFIFGGVKKGATLVLGSSQIFVIDGSGAVVDTWNSGSHPEMGWLRFLKVMENGKILMLGHYLVGEQNGAAIVQPTLSLLDMDTGDFEWVNHFGRIDKGERQIQFWDMESLSGNEFIGAGQSRIEVDGVPEQSGWLMKFNTEGDSIWSRYDFPDFPVDSLGDTFFGGVGVLSSGSIVAGGTATLWNEQAIWLVKVTPDGCLEVIDCGPVPTTARPVVDEGLDIYPNPADGSLTVSLKMEPKSSGAIELYNLNGQLVASKKFAKGEKVLSLDTYNIPEGFYLVRAVVIGKTIQAGKVILNH